MYTKILGQPPIRTKSQFKRTEGFIYSFLFNLKRDNGAWTVNWTLIEMVISDCLFRLVGGVGTGAERKLNLKDLELSVDISSRNYTVRFFSDKDLTEDAYAYELRWFIDGINGYFENFPYKYIQDGKLDYDLEPVPLDEIEEC